MNNTVLQVVEKLNSDKSLEKTELYRLYVLSKGSSTPEECLFALDSIDSKLYDSFFLNEVKMEMGINRNTVHDFLRELSSELVGIIQESLKDGFILEKESKAFFYTDTDDEDIAQLKLNKIDKRYSISIKHFINYKDWFPMYEYELI